MHDDDINEMVGDVGGGNNPLDEHVIELVEGFTASTAEASLLKDEVAKLRHRDTIMLGLIAIGVAALLVIGGTLLFAQFKSVHRGKDTNYLVHIVQGCVEPSGKCAKSNAQTQARLINGFLQGQHDQLECEFDRIRGDRKASCPVPTVP